MCVNTLCYYSAVLLQAAILYSCLSIRMFKYQIDAHLHTIVLYLI